MTDEMKPSCPCGSESYRVVSHRVCNGCGTEYLPLAELNTRPKLPEVAALSKEQRSELATWLVNMTGIWCDNKNSPEIYAALRAIAKEISECS